MNLFSNKHNIILIDLTSLFYFKIHYWIYFGDGHTCIFFHENVKLCAIWWPCTEMAITTVTGMSVHRSNEAYIDRVRFCFAVPGASAVWFHAARARRIGVQAWRRHHSDWSFWPALVDRRDRNSARSLPRHLRRTVPHLTTQRTVTNPRMNERERKNKQGFLNTETPTAKAQQAATLPNSFSRSTNKKLNQSRPESF